MSLAPALLDEVCALAAQPPASPEVDFVGADPVLPTTFRLGEAGAASIAASAVQAARLWQQRGGSRQRVHVAIDAAAAAMRSARYLRVESTEPVRRAPRAGGGVGFFRTRDDRWMYYQRLFPHHRARMCAVLGCDDEDESIRAATAEWDAQPLEDAIAANGSCGAFARTEAEWAVHPQAVALTGLPLFEILKVDDAAPPRTLTPVARPLAGVRVLDLTRVLAGPTAARTLAEHGADVLRIGTRALPDNDAMMRDTGHGKRSAALDLTQADDAAQLRALTDQADVFVQGYPPGTMDARGFGVDEVVRRRPGIVYVSLSAFGHTGPWSARRGFDSVVQAANGIAAASAQDGVPRFAPANPLDYITGYLAAFGALVAFECQAREGGSYLVRLSLAQTGRWLASLPRVDPDAAAALPADLPAERLSELMMTSETPFGRLRHLAPAAQLSATPGYWARPSVPLDHDGATWLAPDAPPRPQATA